MIQTRTLFILAGYPASGKSTILQDAAKNGGALFGSQFAAEVRSALFATEFDENIPARLKLDRGMWMDLFNIDDLEAMADLPQNLVFHLDLLKLLAYALKPQRLSDIAPDRQQACFDGFLRRKLLTRYDRLVITTLKPEIAVIQDLWRRKREGQKVNSDTLLAIQRDLLINVPDPGGVYETVMQSWLDAAARKTPYTMVMTGSREPVVPQSQDT